VDTVVGVYCVGAGALMLVWWAVEVRGGVFRRPDQTRAELGLHVVAEVVTALVLVVGGVLLMASTTELVALVGLGMLLYAAIQSPGYFLARGELLMVAVFAVLVLLTLGATAAVLV
jgi:hypothetical protein